MSFGMMSAVKRRNRKSRWPQTGFPWRLTPPRSENECRKTVPETATDAGDPQTWLHYSKKKKKKIRTLY